jgi:hypothetical protein
MLLGKTKRPRLPFDEAVAELAARALLPTEMPRLFARALYPRSTPAELAAYQRAERQGLRMLVDDLLDDPPWTLTPSERNLIQLARGIPRDRLVGRLLDPLPARTRPLSPSRARGMAGTTPKRKGARTTMGAAAAHGWQGQRTFPVARPRIRFGRVSERTLALNKLAVARLRAQRAALARR